MSKTFCVNPIIVSGQIQRCNSKDYLYCLHCSKIYQRDRISLIESGIDDLDKYSYILVTNTAPSFGSIASEDGVSVGFPSDSSRYRYFDQVRWNANASTLFRFSIKYITDRVGYDFGWASVKEWQKRGVLHFHTLFRVETVHVVEFLNVLKSFKTFKANGFGWGREFDVKLVDNEELSNVVFYLTKALTVSVRQHSDEYGSIKNTRLKDHFEKLDAAVLYLSNDLSEIKKGSAVDNFGWSGHFLTISKNWSFNDMTLSKLKDIRREWVFNQGFEDEDNEYKNNLLKTYYDNVSEFSMICQNNEKHKEDRYKSLFEDLLNVNVDINIVRQNLTN